jgi:ribosome recycling factor
MKDEVIEESRREMEQALAAFRHELSRVRTGRASTALIEGLSVNYH